MDQQPDLSPKGLFFIPYPDGFGRKLRLLKCKATGPGPWNTGGVSVDARNTADEQIRRLMESYGTAMLRMCYLSLHDAMLAEDAV